MTFGLPDTTLMSSMGDGFSGVQGESRSTPVEGWQQARQSHRVPAEFSVTHKPLSLPLGTSSHLRR
jgi:hypothetical protein